MKEQDRILTLAGHLVNYINDMAENTDMQMHETIAALDIAKNFFYRNWAKRIDENFDAQLKKLTRGQ